MAKNVQKWNLDKLEILGEEKVAEMIAIMGNKKEMENRRNMAKKSATEIKTEYYVGSTAMKPCVITEMIKKIEERK